MNKSNSFISTRETDSGCTPDIGNSRECYVRKDRQPLLTLQPSIESVYL